MTAIEKYFDGNSYYRIVEQKIDPYIGPELRDPTADLLVEMGNAFTQILADITQAGDLVDELHIRIHLVHADMSKRELQIMATTRRPYTPVSVEDGRALQRMRGLLP